MNTNLAKNILEVIRNEKHLRVSLLDDNSEAANDHWTFTDAPFLAELCLMLLVALHHQLEREFIGLAARLGEPPAPNRRQRATRYPNCVNI